MERTTVEVAKVLPGDATITQAETAAAVEAARATSCRAQTGQIIFGLDGNLIEEWDKNAKWTKNRMKEHTEERRKRKLADEDFASSTDNSHSHSASLSAVISESISAKVMTSSRYFKLGARPKWTTQPAPTQPCPNCGETTIPPWRPKPVWRITSTKTVEGLLTENPSNGSKQKTEELCEMMKKKHAME